MQDRKVFCSKEIHEYQNNIKWLFMVYYNFLDYCNFLPILKKIEKENSFEFKSLDSPWVDKYKGHIVKILPYKLSLYFH